MGISWTESGVLDAVLMLGTESGFTARIINALSYQAITPVPVREF